MDPTTAESRYEDVASNEALSSSALWHPDVHFALGERLLFVRITFERYSRSVVVSKLHEALRGSDIKSYAVYELFGVHDILVRCWFGAASTASRVAGHMRQELASAHLSLLEYFEVDEILTHFHWNDTQLVSQADPASVGDLSLLETVDSKALDLAQEGVSSLLAQGTAALLGWNAYRLLAHKEDNARVFIFVSSPNGMVTEDVKTAHRQAVRATVLEAMTRHSLELSLYWSEGSRMGAYLISGYVHLSDLYGPVRELSLALSESQLIAATGVRTITLIAATPLPLHWSERSPDPGTDSSNDLATVLDLSRSRRSEPTGDAAENTVTDSSILRSFVESSTFEVKASLALDVDKYLRDAEQPERPSLKKRPRQERAIAKATAGFLNSRADSTLVIGLYEKDRLRGHDHSKQAIPDRDRFLILGVDLELDVYEWTLEEWQGHLDQALLGLIEPSPDGLFEVSYLSIESRTLANVFVRGSLVRDDDWFYTTEGENKTFYVRSGPHTRSLSGTAADRYKAVRGRTLRTGVPPEAPPPKR